MIKRIFVALVIVTITGCAKPVSYTLSGRYMLLRPVVIVVPPVEWGPGVETKREGVDELLRTIVIEKLKSLNYDARTFEDAAAGAGPSVRKDPEGMPPHELARTLKSDGVLYMEITEWDEKLFVTYASLRVGVNFELYSATGEMLWRAGYRTKESDLRLDKPTMELAVIKTFEPRLQRLVDLVFATLPSGPERTGEKRFFDWLP